MIKKNLIFIFIIYFSTAAIANSDFCAGKRVLGRVEKVLLVENNIILNAKLDTGAAMSSLSAKNIKIYKKNNQEWVRFVIITPAIHQVTMNKPLIRYVGILARHQEKQDDLVKKYNQRAVVIFNVRLGNITQKIFVNLTDRSDFIYPLLLGRDAIKKFDALVDVSRKYMVVQT